MSDDILVAMAAAAAGKATEAIFDISKSAFVKLKDVLSRQLAKNPVDERALMKATHEQEGEAAVKVLATRIEALRTEDREFDQLLESIVPSSSTIHWEDNRGADQSSTTFNNHGPIQAKNFIQNKGNIENLRLD